MSEEISQVEMIMIYKDGTGKRCRVGDPYSAALHLLRKCEPEQLQHLKLHDLHNLQMKMQGIPVTNPVTNPNTKVNER